MSLFGDADNSRQPSLAPDNTFPDSLSPSDSDSNEELQSAQLAPYETTDADEAEEEGEEEEEELTDVGGEDLEAGEESRPNRFRGNASTWRKYTAADRRIAASLDQAQAADLSAHLYNAHALKRRVRLPQEELANVKDWQGKDSWLGKREDLTFTDILGYVQTELVPPKRWTAWPLPASDVPAPSENFGQRRLDDDTGSWQLEERDEDQIGDGLREEILAVFLRLAKEKWQSRDTEDVPPIDASVRLYSKSRSRSKSAQPAKTGSSSPDSEQDQSDVDMHGGNGMKMDDSEALTSSSERKWAHIISSRKRKRKLQPPPMKATILADDDTARDLLQPSINFLLSRLDSLAAAIRRSRLNHFKGGTDSATSGSEFTSDVESMSSKPRSRRTSKKPRPESLPSTGLHLASESRRGNRSRNLLQTNDDAAFEDADGSMSETAETSKSKRKRSRSQGPPPETGLMDWSEILGAASMIGFSEQVIARTTQRCSTLFEEIMAFRSFDESLAGGPLPEAVQYTPSAIPPPDILGIQPSAAPPKRPFFDTASLRCPYTDCPRHKKDYPKAFIVVEHIMRVHGYDPRTNDSDNEERRHGGVHKDGFLQPITAKQGWRKGKRPKSAGEG